jgi:tripartite-type tricarboxylate transporter receptor subunit TctC
MHRVIRQSAFIAAFIAAFVAPVLPAYAQGTFPSRPVKVYSPLPPGGAIDAMLRHIGEAYQQRTGQPLVIENKPGANTIVTADACAKAPADGYTICMLSSSTTSLNPFLYKKLPYTAASFAPITQIATATQVLVSSRNLPATTIPELVKYSKANPGKLNYGSFGVGNDGHLALEWLTRTTGADMKHIPYKGAAPEMLAFRANDIQVMFLILGNPGLVEQIKSGEMRALAVTGTKRSPMLPDVPTFIEAGYPYKGQSWFGFFAPAGTPKAVVEKLNADLTAVIRSPDLRKSFFEPSGFDVVGNSSAEFAAFLAADAKVGADLVKLSGVHLDE